MKFIDVAKKRFSSRKYKNIPIEEHKLLYVLQAGRIAPSAANFQPWYFVVIKDPENIEKMGAVYKRAWMREAAVLLVICGDHSVSWKRADGKDHCDIDIAITTDHITLAATEMDLATCWICNFDAKKCSELLHLPPHIEPMVILTLAYPADEANTERHTTQRKPLDAIVRWEKFE